ncbi:hypothetical protein F9C11_20710 [Amycolatopsis sp. VS8301801F10]|uniref:hypothetical protein n=1 Tax=Amycolatopsis sp. VS8301801F10 TaxID=2652442 RepID=UPI0038FCF387
MARKKNHSVEPGRVAVLDGVVFAGDLAQQIPARRHRVVLAQPQTVVVAGIALPPARSGDAWSFSAAAPPR